MSVWAVRIAWQISAERGVGSPADELEHGKAARIAEMTKRTNRHERLGCARSPAELTKENPDSTRASKQTRCG